MIKKGLPFVLLFCFLANGLTAATIILGSDGTGPVQLLLTDGTPIQSFGALDGTAGASDGNNGIFVAIPGLDSSTINDYDPAQNLLNSFSFLAPGDLRTDAAYITDLAWGNAGTIWVSTFTGEVYHLSATGTVLSSFDTGATSPGVAFDGTSVYTTGGPGFLGANPFIYQRDTSGNILNIINTGLNDTLGLGFDSTDSTLWVGGFDVVTQVDLSGNNLQSLAIGGTHYGLDLTSSETPEPGTWVFLLTGIAGMAAWKSRRKLAAICLGIWLLLLASPLMHGAVTINSFSSAPSGPQPVGSTLTLSASASDTDSGALRYRFRILPPGGQWTVLRDYSPATAVFWTPVETDGAYQVEVSVINRSTNSILAQTLPVSISSNVTESAPVVNPTSHPLVALYSGPSCKAGANMRVRFKLPADTVWQTTPLKPCNGTSSMNFYIAGMRASSTYQLRQDVISGPQVVSGPILNFTSGSIPGGFIPATNAILPLKAPSSTTEGVTLFAGLNLQGYFPYAVDSGMNPIWYSLAQGVYLTRAVPGGGYLVSYGFGTDLTISGIREYDLASNLVKETTVERMNDQLAARSLGPITAFHHEVRKLANGNYLTMGMRELVSSVQGPPNDIVGDMILVLDNNLQLLWTWDSFDHLDLTRPAVLGENCAIGPGLCVLFNGPTAHDWTHGNSAALTPDGNILYSSRHQDLAYKIAYENGTGDGHVIWKLGKDGDFNWLSSDPYPWFSHQHDVEFEDATTVSVFDDGNVRVQAHGGNSRGQGLHLDELNMTVTPIVNVDLGAYSFALGSAQRLLNGNYVFDNGWIGSLPNTQSAEWTAAGAAVSNVHTVAINYRTFRLRDLYSALY